MLVVLPTLGQRLDYLRQTLDTIDNQKLDVNLRLVVVMPEKATAARDLAARYGAEIVDDPGTGLTAAMNAGLESRQAEKYYAWMGDDDLFRPGSIASLVGLLEADPLAVLAFGSCDYIGSEGHVLWTNTAKSWASKILTFGPNLIPHPGSLIRFEALEQVGAYNENYPYAMDLDLMIRLKSVGNFVSTRETVSAFRWHADSTTVSNRSASAQEAKEIKLSSWNSSVRPVLEVVIFFSDLATRFASFVISRKARTYS